MSGYDMFVSMCAVAGHFGMCLFLTNSSQARTHFHAYL